MERQHRVRLSTARTCSPSRLLRSKNDLNSESEQLMIKVSKSDIDERSAVEFIIVVPKNQLNGTKQKQNRKKFRSERSFFLNIHDMKQDLTDLILVRKLTGYSRHNWQDAPEDLKKIGRVRNGDAVEYEVEDILARNTYVGGLTVYKVKWKNWSSSYNTWEKEESLKNCKEILEKFNLEAKSVVPRPRRPFSSTPISSPASKDTTPSLKNFKDALKSVSPITSIMKTDIATPSSTGRGRIVSPATPYVTSATRITDPGLISRLKKLMVDSKNTNGSVIEFISSEDKEHAKLVQDLLLNEQVQSIGDGTPTKICGFQMVNKIKCVRVRWENGLIELINYEDAKTKFGIIMEDLVRKFKS